MIIERPHDLDLFFFLMMEGPWCTSDPLAYAFITGEMGLQAAGRLCRPFDDDLSGVEEAAGDLGEGSPFVAVAFRGDTHPVRYGEEGTWQASLDELIVRLAEAERILVACFVYDSSDNDVWMVSGEGILDRLTGFDHLATWRVGHEPRDRQAFAARCTTDAMAARERILERAERGA